MSDQLDRIRALRLRFTSGNSVPVERAYVTSTDWMDIWLALDDCAETMELEGLHSSEAYQKLKRLLDEIDTRTMPKGE